MGKSIAVSSIMQPTEFVSIRTNNWYELTVQLNWVALIITVIVVLLAIWGFKRIFKKKTGRTIKIDGLTLGIGDFKCDLKCSSEVQEIAYQLWVELITRKIAIPFDEDDVIEEIYESWYSAFQGIRIQLKSVPGRCLVDASDLIDVTTKVLNEGLRPHLTKWQAKYRSWYENEKKTCNDSPQVIQKRYPEYNALVDDMKRANENIVNFSNTLKKIAFG